jgi:hypothetical protein
VAGGGCLLLGWFACAVLLLRCLVCVLVVLLLLCAHRGRLSVLSGAGGRRRAGVVPLVSLVVVVGLYGCRALLVCILSGGRSSGGCWSCLWRCCWFPVLVVLRWVLCLDRFGWRCFGAVLLWLSCCAGVGWFWSGGASVLLSLLAVWLSFLFSFETEKRK